MIDEVARVDWSELDVLVGSFKSVSQFEYNLDKKFYYTPYAFLDGSHTVRYVALYQSATNFGDRSGIWYYGEVRETRKVKRRDIPLKMNRDNGDEPYAVFFVHEWKQLPTPIAIRDDGVYKPRYTNFFLLTNSSYTYELFNIKSTPQYNLSTTLKQVFTFAELNQNSEEYAFKVDEKYSIILKDNKINVERKDGKRLFKNPLLISEFLLFPRDNFNEIVRKLKM